MKAASERVKQEADTNQLLTCLKKGSHKSISNAEFWKSVERIAHNMKLGISDSRVCQYVNLLDPEGASDLALRIGHNSSNRVPKSTSKNLIADRKAFVSRILSIPNNKALAFRHENDTKVSDETASATLVAAGGGAVGGAVSVAAIAELASVQPATASVRSAAVASKSRKSTFTKMNFHRDAAIAPESLECETANKATSSNLSSGSSSSGSSSSSSNRAPRASVLSRPSIAKNASHHIYQESSALNRPTDRPTVTLARSPKIVRKLIHFLTVLLHQDVDVFARFLHHDKHNPNPSIDCGDLHSESERVLTGVLGSGTFDQEDTPIKDTPIGADAFRAGCVDLALPLTESDIKCIFLHYTGPELAVDCVSNYERVSTEGSSGDSREIPIGDLRESPAMTLNALKHDVDQYHSYLLKLKFYSTSRYPRTVVLFC